MGGQIIHADDVDPKMPNFRSVLQVDEELYIFVPKGNLRICSTTPAHLMQALAGQIELIAMRDLRLARRFVSIMLCAMGQTMTSLSVHVAVKIAGDMSRAADWSRPELWDRYDGYFSPYLARRIEALKEKKSVSTAS